MKAVLMSIQPEWCKLIAGGKKTIEVRKSKQNWQRRLRCISTARKTVILKELLSVSSCVTGLRNGTLNIGMIIRSIKQSVVLTMTTKVITNGLMSLPTKMTIQATITFAKNRVFLLRKFNDMQVMVDSMHGIFLTFLSIASQRN